MCNNKSFFVVTAIKEIMVNNIKYIRGVFAIAALIVIGTGSLIANARQKVIPSVLLKKNNRSLKSRRLVPTHAQIQVKDETIHAITREIRVLKEIMQSLSWFEVNMRSGRLRLDGYSRTLLEHALTFCNELSLITTSSDIDGDKFNQFRETVSKMFDDTLMHTPGNVRSLREYVLSRLTHRYDEISRLLMRRGRVSQPAAEGDLEKIYTTFGYNVSQLYRSLNIPSDAVLQDVTHIIATYFAPAVADGNVSLQQVLYNAYKVLVRTRGLAFLVNQKNLFDLQSSENIGTQLAVIFEYVSRQKSLYRSFRTHERLLRGEYPADTLAKARYMSYALSTFASIWQLALKHEIVRWGRHHKEQGKDVINQFQKLVSQSLNHEFDWSLDDLRAFMKRF